MRMIVVGLGVQGQKRRQHAGSDCVATVDSQNEAAAYKDVIDVPLCDFDAALVCLPDQPKYAVLKYLLENNKHVLVEKPLWTERNEQIFELQSIARNKKLVCYTAYNHRFEPHILKMKELIDSGELGTLYHCRLFYGNGTARLVYHSVWRDAGSGVLGDLCCHLLDIINFWFSTQPTQFESICINRFENKAPDHVIVMNRQHQPQFNFEMSLLSWRNHFSCDLYAENGSAHIESLCKWGPSHFTHRQRILPSGRPPEKSITLVQEDPTWALEYQYFKRQIEFGVPTNLEKEVWIQSQLRKLYSEDLLVVS